MKKILCCILAAVMIFSLCSCGSTAGESSAPGSTGSPEPTATSRPTASPTPSPVPTATPEPTAEELTYTMTIGDSDGNDPSQLTDGDIYTGYNYWEKDTLTITSDTPIYGVYFIWKSAPCSYLVTSDDGLVQAGGTFGCLHEYFSFEEPTNEIDVEMTGFSVLLDVRAFGEGDLPEDVQLWQAPTEEADVCFFPCHADDDVIFMGALIADCVARGLEVQVCYMVSHENPRPQELLNALWSMGVRRYPIFGGFLDYYMTSLDEAKEEFEQENVTGYIVECLRRFKPSVAVGHDLGGEYGHGAHRLYAESLTYAVNVAGDASVYKRSANVYGVWDTPKCYLHMYSEGELEFDFSQPLEYFGGRSAFEVATEAMEYHESQLQYPYRPQLGPDGYDRFDCQDWGLYRSLVGEDTETDIMCNVTTKAAQRESGE